MELVDPGLIYIYFWSIVEDATFSFADVLLLAFWIKNKFAKIVGKSSFVRLESFLGSIFAPVVDIDSNRSSELYS